MCPSPLPGNAPLLTPYSKYRIHHIQNLRLTLSLIKLSNILKRNAIEYLKSNILLDRNQSCYRREKSTQTALFKFMDDIGCTIEDCKLTVLILFEIFKAFRLISSHIEKYLLQKLRLFCLSNLAVTYLCFNVNKSFIIINFT